MLATQSARTSNTIYGATDSGFLLFPSYYYKKKEADLKKKIAIKIRRLTYVEIKNPRNWVE